MNSNLNSNLNLIDAVDHPTQVLVLEMINSFMKNFNYLIVDTYSRHSVIVDPAWQMEKVDKALVDSKSLLQGVLLTHSHPDHIHLAKTVADKYQCPIWMSKEEIDFSHFRASQLVAIDEQPWSIGKTLITPIFTPGHTPGCMCYHIGDNLFTGDTLFAEGCGMCPSHEAAGIMFDSLAKLQQLSPNTHIYPGHSYGKQPGQLLASVTKENMYLQFRRRQDFIAFRMRKGQDKLKMFGFF